MRFCTILVATLLFVSCSYDKDELPSPGEVQQSAISGTITYTGHTKRLFDTYCINCHQPGATQQFFPLTSFTEVSVYSGAGGSIQTRVLNQGNMPPTGNQLQLTVAEKDTLQLWLNQGAPL